MMRERAGLAYREAWLSHAAPKLPMECFMKPYKILSWYNLFVGELSLFGSPGDSLSFVVDSMK